MDNYKYTQSSILPHESIWKEDLILEQIAHDLAYKSQKNKKYIKDFKSSFKVHKIKFFTGTSGLQMVSVEPKIGISNLNHNVLAFRGTDFIADVIEDLNPISIGRKQFKKNKKNIEKIIGDIGTNSPVILTGHSLGGALSQLVASKISRHIYKKINRIVTFQSPGIHFKDLNVKRKINSIHYRMNDALVDKAGYVFTPGNAIVFNFYNDSKYFKYISPIYDATLAHKYFPLSQLHKECQSMSVDINSYVSMLQINSSQIRPLEELRKSLSLMFYLFLKIIKTPSEPKLKLTIIGTFIKVWQYKFIYDLYIASKNKFLRNSTNIEKIFLTELILHLHYVIEKKPSVIPIKIIEKYFVHLPLLKLSILQIISSLNSNDLKIFKSHVEKIDIFPYQKEYNYKLLEASYKDSSIV